MSATSPYAHLGTPPPEPHPSGIDQHAENRRAAMAAAVQLRANQVTMTGAMAQALAAAGQPEGIGALAKALEEAPSARELADDLLAWLEGRS